MTASPEIQKTSPASAPIKALDDTLKNFRATLEKRWKEFDEATLEEAYGIESVRNDNKKYKDAKSQYDKAIKTLKTVNNDAELKQSTPILEEITSTIDFLGEYLATANKEKKYTQVLMNMRANLADFKAQITEKAEDKKNADEAKATVATAVAAA